MPWYQSNDDVAMRLIAESGSPFLLFINVLVGKLLAALYGLAPAVPWYDLLLGASLVAATAALLFVWGRRELHWTIALAVFLLLPAFMRVQFTVVAMLCAAAGIALLLRGHPLLGSLLFVWGSLIRFEASMIVVLEAGLLAFPLLRAPTTRRLVVSKTRPFALALAAALALFALHLALDRGDFREPNVLRLRLGEYVPDERVTPAALARLQREVGWSANDYALFRDWFHMLYPPEEVRRAAEVMREPPSPRQGLESMRVFVTSMSWAILLLLAYVLGRPRRALFSFAFAMVVLVLLAGVIGMAAKPLPPWVALPMIVFAATLLVLREDPPPRRWIAFAALLLALYAAGPWLPALYRKGRAKQRAAELARRDVASLRRLGARLFILHGGAFPYEDYWQPLRPTAPPFPFVSLASGATRSDPGLPWRLCTDPGLVLVAYPHIPARLARYVAEHRGVEVRFERVYASERINAWRCRASSVTRHYGPDGRCRGIAASSLTMRAVPALPLESTTVKVSSISCSVSPCTITSIVFAVSPGWNVSVPAAGT